MGIYEHDVVIVGAGIQLGRPSACNTSWSAKLEGGARPGRCWCARGRDHRGPGAGHEVRWSTSFAITPGCRAPTSSPTRPERARRRRCSTLYATAQEAGTSAFSAVGSGSPRRSSATPRSCGRSSTTSSRYGSRCCGRPAARRGRRCRSCTGKGRAHRQ